jgi:hypothetical protein
MILIILESYKLNEFNLGNESAVKNKRNWKIIKILNS